MGQTVICRVMPKAEHGIKVVMLDVFPANGGVQWQLRTSQTQDLKLQFGDRLKCVSGSAVVLINPGTSAGAFILSSKLPAQHDAKERTELEINEETTRIVHRGQITFARDIGNTSRGTKSVR